MKHILFMFFAFSTYISVAQQINFTKPEGWEQDRKAKTFNKDNLFDHINGASEFYFSYNFEELHVASFKKEESELTIEVYDHGDSVHAYGIYSMERPSKAKTKAFGLQGYSDSSTLNFVTGRYYVKIMTHGVENAENELLPGLARELAPKLCNNPGMPPVIDAFPSKGLVTNSRQYISENFMGFGFLGSAYRAKYTSGDKDEYTVFIIKRKNSEAIAEVVKKYHEFTSTELKKVKEGTFTIEDPFNGTVKIKWKGKYLIGATGDIEDKQLARLRKKISMALPR